MRLQYMCRPPSTVIRQHRRKAEVFWAVALIIFISVSAAQIVAIYNKRKNPNVNVRIVTETQGTYPMPDIGVCIAPGQGCVGDAAVCLQSGQGTAVLEEGFTGRDTLNATLDQVTLSSRKHAISLCS
jgi:hypothetical protein